jgi:hypothetical protein
MKRLKKDRYAEHTASCRTSGMTQGKRIGISGKVCHKKPGMGLFVKIMDVALPPGGADEFYKRLDGKRGRMSVEYVRPVYHVVDVKPQMTLRNRRPLRQRTFFALCVSVAFFLHLLLSPFLRFEARRNINHDSVASLFYDVKAGA